MINSLFSNVRFVSTLLLKSLAILLFFVFDDPNDFIIDGLLYNYRKPFLKNYLMIVNDITYYIFMSDFSMHSTICV